MLKPKLKKITLEYEDCTMSLEGKDAELWKKESDYIATFAYCHGYVMTPLPWKEINNDI